MQAQHKQKLEEQKRLAHLRQRLLIVGAGRLVWLDLRHINKT
ncbi:hypothetical protein [Fischerella thermalis]